jgi:superfamily II DNA or RNA helicase
MVELGQLEGAIWSIADGRGSNHDLELLYEGGSASLALLDRLIYETEDSLESVRNLNSDERDQVVADFVGTIRSLRETAASLRSPVVPPEPVEPDEVALHASWSVGRIVVWAAGRGAQPEPNEQLAARLEKCSAPPQGWELHAPVQLPEGMHADALSIPVKDALGWLLAVGADQDADGVGEGLVWLGRVALEGVRQVAGGSIVPGLEASTRVNGRSVDTRVRWLPALVDGPTIDAFTAAMPGTVVAVSGASGRSTTIAVLAGVVEAIVTASVERMELPAQPPTANSSRDFADTIIARMDGTEFAADRDLARDTARRMDQWARTVTHPGPQRLVVRLDEPGPQGVWIASVQASVEKGKLVAIDTALRTGDTGRVLANEWARLERSFPALGRTSIQRRGQVVLSQAEAWEFMTDLGPALARLGFDIRAPQLSRRAARPSLHMFTEARAGSTVGAHQLSNVTWTVLFDDIELTAADIARLAKQARPLLQSRGKWVSIDRVDLERAAAALSEREAITQMTGAEILRQTVGLDGSGLSGGVVIHGDSWAKDIVNRANETLHGDRAALDTTPERFVGSLRSYQAEALAWIAFLDASELGGCLALDMGLGKTPTVLAHLARSAGNGTALVVAPAAVVGNWAAEAARFAPHLRIVVHHGAGRSSDAGLAAQIANADLVITTYATAVRDIDALAAATWRTLVLDEAQAIKNPTSETAQQLRRLSARTRLALTGTPIENGVGDLWAILDFTNPGLVGPRPAFVAQMAGDGETALRALNGILLFRRTKTEPEVAAELPDKIDQLDHCTMTPEQIGLYQAVLDDLIANTTDELGTKKKGAILAAITALKQICNHPAAYHDDGLPLAGRSGKLARLEEIVDSVFAADERVLIFTHFATWGRRLAAHLTEVTGKPIACYDGDLSRPTRDRMIADFQKGQGAGAMVLSLKAGGTGLNLTSANHVVLYDRWWNPAIEDQARDRAWRIGQTRTVISHRLVCPGTVDERVEEVVEGKRHIAQLVLPKSSSLTDLDASQLRLAFGLRPDELLTGDEQ